MENTKTKEKRIWILILVLFFVGETIIRFLFANFSKSVNTYRDELFLFQLAKSIYNTGSLSVYGVGTRYQKVLYPLILSPTFFLNDPLVRIKVITVINCILVSSSVFPGYLFTKKLSNNNTKVIALSLLIMAFLPDMCYSTTYMSENLFLPMGLWDIYFMTCLLLEENKKKQIIFSFLIGGFTFLLFLVKMGGLLFVIAFTATCIYLAVHERSFLPFLRRCLGMVAVFALSYIIFKQIFYPDKGNYYSAGLSILGTHYRLEYWLYAIGIHIVFLLFMWMFFFPIVPAISFKSLSKKQQIIYIFMIICVLINAISVSFAITVPEETGRIIPRQHMRYYTPMLFPMFVFLLCFLEQREYTKKNSFNKEKTILLVLAAIFVTSFVFRMNERIPSAMVDQNTIRLYNYSFNFHFTDMVEGIEGMTINNGIILLKGLVVVWTIVGCFLIYSNHKKLCISFIVISLCLFELINSKLSYRDLNGAYGRDENQVEQALKINEYFKNKDGNILIVVPGDDMFGIFKNRIIDTYVSSDFCVINDDQIQNYSSKGDYIDLSNNPFVPIHELGIDSYSDYKDYKYVISYSEISFDEGKAEQINLDGVDMVYLYQVLTPGQLWINYDTEG